MRQFHPGISWKLPERIFAVTGSRSGGPWAACGKSLLIVALLTGVGFIVNLRVAPANMDMLYLAWVVFTALRWGFAPAAVASVVSSAAFDFLFVPPYLSVAMTDAWYFVTLGTMLSISILVSLLASAAREQMLMARERAAEATALYSLTQSLGAARTTEDVFQAAAGHIQETLGRAIAVLLFDENGALSARYQAAGWKLDGEAIEEVRRFLKMKPDDPHRRSSREFLPLRNATRAIGAIALLPADSPPAITAATERLLEGVAGQVTLAIERAMLEEGAREADIIRKADELHRTLLNSVSHSLRAPLAAILSALDPIAEGNPGIERGAIAELARVAQTEAHRLDTLVGNLLDLSRLEAGALQVRKETHDIRNLIGAATGEIQEWHKRRIEKSVQPGLPLVRVDFVLMVQVLVNLLDNAIKYSPAGLPVLLDARLTGGDIEIRVADSGEGIPAAERENIFEKFSRGSRFQHTPGIGLGLAICKGFVEAHRGRIWVEDRAGGGSVFCFTIPIHDPAPVPGGGYAIRG